MKIHTRTEPNLVGKEFNMLTVIEPAYHRQPGWLLKKGWWCRCKCKKVVFKTSFELINDHAFSCGCTKRGMYSHGITHALPIGAKVDPVKFLPRSVSELEPCYYVSEAV